MDNEDVRIHIKELMPYVYAAGFLSFSGQEINEENITKSLRAAGLNSDPAAIQLLFKTNVRSHLAYIYAYYFLLALGKMGSDSEILALADGLGVKADPSRLKDVLAFLKAPIMAK